MADKATTESAVSGILKIKQDATDRMAWIDTKLSERPIVLEMSEIQAFLTEREKLNKAIETANKSLPAAAAKDTGEVSSRIKAFVTSDPECLAYFRSSGPTIHIQRTTDGVLAVGPTERKERAKSTAERKEKEYTVKYFWGGEGMKTWGGPLRNLVPRGAGESDADYVARVKSKGIAAVTFPE